MLFIQRDRGKEFFVYSVQDRLMERGIKFRPIKPGSPHLNGKVERTQRTDLDESYSTVDIKDPDLPNLLSQWQFYYAQNNPVGIDDLYLLTHRSVNRCETSTSTILLPAPRKPIIKLRLIDPP